MKKFRITYYLANGHICHPAGEYDTYSDAREAAQINRNHNPRIVAFEVKS